MSLVVRAYAPTSDAVGCAAMEILSTAWRTDLALLAASGSTIEHRGGHVVVRTPANPGFWWGNFLLLPRVPLRRDVGGWLRVFEQELPGVAHRAIGIDDPEVSSAELRPFTDAGFEVEVCAVLTASEVQAPRRPAVGVAMRRLETDADWAQRLVLSEQLFGPQAGRSEFARRRVDAERALAQSGRGAWFGAFDRGEMVSGLGIFDTGDGAARFQSVETAPGHRRRGLATTLVHVASRFALDDLGITRLVIVSASEGRARRVYESVGFRESERQAQVHLPPAGS
jgi:RimJ/RimL family protein N-acetyltransferase